MTKMNKTQHETGRTSRLTGRAGTKEQLMGLSLALVSLFAAGCAGRANVETPDLEVAMATVGPRISQVAVAPQLAGATGNQEGALMGRSVVVADFNGDGYADVAAGMPGADGGRGAVALIYGGPDGLELTSPNLSNRARINPGSVMGFGSEREGDQFGYALAAGDFDGDGIADLAISAPFRSVNNAAGAGQVYVFYGSALKGPSGMRHTRLPQTITQTGAGVNEAGDHFGMALAAGDFNGDGYSDLAIGTPDEDEEATGRTDSGVVFVRYGSASGLMSGGFHYINARRDPVRQAYKARETQAHERFGAALAAGRLETAFAGRPVDHLIVGAPGSNLEYDSVTSGHMNFRGAGRIYVFKGVENDHWLTHKVDIVVDMAPFGVVGFGSSLAIGDFDGNGQPDLAAGAPEAYPSVPAGQGRVFLMFDNVNGSVGQYATPDERNTTWFRAADSDFGQSPISDTKNGDRFGFALAAADFDHDGITDLAIGSPTEDFGEIRDSGLVFVLKGSASLRSRNVNRYVDLSYGGPYYFLTQKPRGSDDPGDQFGFALATGNIDNDLYPDLVIGAPYEYYNGVRDQGAVFVARTRNAAPGPFEGVWTGTVNGDRGTSATLTATLYGSSDGTQVSGSAVLSNSLTFRRCQDLPVPGGVPDVRTGTTADINGVRGSSWVGTPFGVRALDWASGTLENMELPGDATAAMTFSLMTVPAPDPNNRNTVAGVIKIRNVIYKGIRVGSCADIDIHTVLTRAQ
jgi:hypothetical protein